MKSALEVELTGVTSVTSDVALARVRWDRGTTNTTLNLRTGYTLASSKTYSPTSRSNKTRTLLLDTRWAFGPGRSFWVANAASNMRMRDEATRQYPRKAGYVLVSGGRGIRLGENLQADIGLGMLNTYDTRGRDSQPAVNLHLRSRYPLGQRLTFDGLATGIFPREDGFRLDSDLALSYKLTSELFLRLGWSANNLVVPVLGAGDWDTTTRITFLYRK